MAQDESDVTLILVAGVEGPSVYLNDHRIAGPKPWGGGEVIHEWRVRVAELDRALNRGSNGTS